MKRTVLLWTMAAAIAILGVLGCDHKPPAGEPTPSPGSSRSPSAATEGKARRAARDITNADRLAAMLSVHANANWPGERPEGLREIESLAAAVDILTGDEGKLALSRRRRAIGKLAGYGIERFETEIARLGGDPGDIKQKIEQESGRRGEVFRANAAERETFVNDLIASKFDPPCIWTKLRYNVSGDEDSVWVNTTLEVNRGVNTVAKTIDPQAWDMCSKFWYPPGDQDPAGAYLATEDAGGNIVAEPALPFGQQYGGTLGTKRLFEHFKCRVVGCDADFGNLLFVSTWWTMPTPGIDRYDAAYSLDHTKYGSIQGTPQKLKVDQGGLTAIAEAGGGTVVSVRKKLRYESAAATGMAQAILEYTESSGEFAELVCCAVDQAEAPQAGGTPEP